MIFLEEATKVVWLSVLLLVGIIAAFMVVIAGGVAIIQIYEDMKNAKDR